MTFPQQVLGQVLPDRTALCRQLLILQMPDARQLLLRPRGARKKTYPQNGPYGKDNSSS